MCTPWKLKFCSNWMEKHQKLVMAVSSACKSSKGERQIFHKIWILICGNSKIYMTICSAQTANYLSQHYSNIIAFFFFFLLEEVSKHFFVLLQIFTEKCNAFGTSVSLPNLIGFGYWIQKLLKRTGKWTEHDNMRYLDNLSESG